MNLILQWLEGQFIKAKWSWPTTVYGIILGLSLLLPEMGKFLDGDVKTVPSEGQMAAGLAAMGLGWASKSNGNHGLPPAKMVQDAVKAPKDDPTKVTE